MRSFIRYRLGSLRAVLLLVVLLAAPVAPAFAESANASLADLDARIAAVNTALDWLLAQQAADGSIGDNVSNTIEAVLAGAAAERDVSQWAASPGRPSALEYLAVQADSYAADAATSGKLLVAVAAAGEDPTRYGGVDLVARLLSFLADDGGLSETTLGAAWGILGLAAAGESVGADIADALIALQQDDGGWEGAPGWGTDSNSTALALQALAAAGVPSDATVFAEGRIFLQDQLSPEGGMTYSAQWGTDPDANSTAYGLQGVLALGEDATSDAWMRGGVSLAQRLLALQLPSGALEWQAGEGENLLATAQSVGALLGRPLPLRSARAAVRDALAHLRLQQEADGSFSSGFGSNVASSAQVLATLAAVGEDAAGWTGSSGASLLDYLIAEAPSVEDAGTAGRLALAFAMAGVNPRDAGGADLVAVIEATYEADSGTYDSAGGVWSHALALWGLAAAGESIPAEAVHWLQSAQNDDGGWGWADGQPSDSNSTALAVQALRGAGVAAEDDAITRAVDYFRTVQADDASLGYDSSTLPDTDANSTSMAIQALLAAGVEPDDWTQLVGSRVCTPIDSLLAYQLADGGFAWQIGDEANFLATVQTIPALAGVAFPNGRQATVHSARTAGVLAADAPVQGRLPGRGGGAHVFYTFEASIGEPEITLTLRTTAGNGTIAGAVGVVVYGPYGEVAHSTPGLSDASTVRFAPAATGGYTVRIYNYTQDVPVDYVLER